MPMTITSIESTECFVGSEEQPRQVLRVSIGGQATPGSTSVTVTGDAAGTLTTAGDAAVFEVPVTSPAPVGATVDVAVEVRRGGEAATGDGRLTVAEPGWTMHMVSHFHYDPVWWNTQAAYTSEWDGLPGAQNDRAAFQHPGFHLVDAHLELARRDPEYRFVLAEVDYLKPYWDMFPQQREFVRKLMSEGRLELMGGTYNEPNTNLTGAETTIRNVVHGIGFQHHVMGGNPATAWQLDVFGHDPQFPGLMADAGLTSSSWARGPFHHSGPHKAPGSQDAPQADVEGMQFRSEFEWVSPSGRGLLTSYMAAHYSAGWRMDSAATLEEAEKAVYQLFLLMKKVAATRNVLLPVGTDYAPPNRWVTAIQRDWNARYVWPRFTCAVPRDFFSAVTMELAETGAQLSPQTRDMNPIYTGKDVSYIDTKLAQRATENLLLDAEKFATLACLVGGARYPGAACDKAWRQLVYGAHHDAITGSGSDQVYIDLLTGWREAWDLAREIRDRAVQHLTSCVDTRGAECSITVFNSMSWNRTDVVTVASSLSPSSPSLPERGRLLDGDGNAIPFVREPGGALVFVAHDVPGVGYRTYRFRAEPLYADGAGGRQADGVHCWQTRDGLTIANEYHRLTVDPLRGGCVSSLAEIGSGQELLTQGGMGNEIVVYEEYPEHPLFHEGPWHLLPTGASVGASATPAISVCSESSPLGQRITVKGTVRGLFYTQVIALWNGVARVDCTTHIDTFTGSDQLVRLRWPCNVHGALPVSEVAGAVIGRGFAYPDSDSAIYPWTLDNPAYRWFGLSSMARIALHDVDGRPTGQCALGVAEIIVPHESDSASMGRPLAVALVQSGVTATCSSAGGTRYGALSFDSNIPDFRIVVGGPDENRFAAAVLAAADVAYRVNWERQIREHGRARLYVPAERSRMDAWHPGVDVLGVRALPVLITGGAGGGGGGALAELVEDLLDSQIDVTQPVAISACDAMDLRTVAILNRGIPGFAVDSTGSMHLSLMRSCTGWPSGVWINPPRRTTPDGSGFQLQHWSHSFEYAIVSGAGDWRDAGVVARAAGYNHPFTAVVDGSHPGTLPSTLSLLSVEPAGRVVISAVKPVGNAMACGSLADPDPRAGVTVRVYEAHGRAVQARVASYIPVESAVVANILEIDQSPVTLDGGVIIDDIAPCNVVTYLLRPVVSGERQSGAELGRSREVAQPVFSRYWLHNRGPAPVGNQPVSVHLQQIEGAAHGQFLISVASDIVDAPVDIWLHIIAPPGWDVDPSERPVRLGPSGWTSFDVTLRPTVDAQNGVYLVTARCEYGGQTYEDVAFVDEHGVACSTADAGPLLEIEVPAAGLVLTPGETATLQVTLSNHAVFDIRGELLVASPFGTWDMVVNPSHPFIASPGVKSVVPVDVTAPWDAPASEFWMLFKCIWFGQLFYSPTVPLRIVST